MRSFPALPCPHLAPLHRFFPEISPISLKDIFIFSLAIHFLAHCNLATLSTTALALSGTPLPLNSLIHWTHFHPIFIFFLVALSIISQLLKLSSSLGPTTPYWLCCQLTNFRRIFRLSPRLVIEITRNHLWEKKKETINE